MTKKQEQIIKKLKKYSTYGSTFGLTISAEIIKEILKLINKPVETTNEQLPTDLKIELMKVMSQHVDLRNSDKLTDRDLYHSFLDWETEVWKLIV